MAASLPLGQHLPAPGQMCPGTTAPLSEPGATGQQPRRHKFVEHGERVEDQEERQLPVGASGFLYNGSTCVSQIRGPADPSIPGRAGPTTGVLEARVTTSAVSPDTRAHAGANSRTRQLFFLLLFLRVICSLVHCEDASSWEPTSHE